MRLPASRPVPEAPDHKGFAHLIVVHPPFAAPVLPDQRPSETPDHDPEAARATVLGLSTVSAVRRERAPSRLALPKSPVRRKDLDEVSVAVWGSTVKITDPALVEGGMESGALEDEFRAQKERYPEALIVAVCSLNFRFHYTKLLAAAPNTPDVKIEGRWSLQTTGEPRAVLAAAGVDLDELDAEYGDEFAPEHKDDDGGGLRDFDGFLHMLTGGALGVYPDEERVHSTFVVMRSKHGKDCLRRIWLPIGARRTMLRLLGYRNQ
ncbi:MULTISPECIES: DUF6333 family protein [unclassified Streptomyces]|uniref:DUF6333 family protein n=1 Tax=unclassified Streptomyces TaxID=2593676 RepID=UPI0035D6AD9B